MVINQINEINEIIRNIEETTFFREYKTYILKNKLDMNMDKNQIIIYNLNKKENIEAFYNEKTCICDNIGVIDINEKRYIDFDDDSWTMGNKGLNAYTQITKFDKSN